MYKKWSALLLVFLLTPAICVPALAKDVLTADVTFNRSTTAVTVAGTSGLSEGNGVQMVALRPGYTFEELETAAQMEAAIARTDETTVGKDGNFLFAPFVLGGALPLGKCEVRVSCGGIAVTKSFYYSPLGKVIEALNRLHDASADVIYDFLITQNNIEPLGLPEDDTAVYTSLTKGTADKPQEQDYVNRYLAERDYAVAATADEATVNAKLLALAADFKTAVAIGLINDAKTATAAESALDAYGDIYALSDQEAVYKSLTDSQKEKAAAEVMKRIAAANRFNDASALQTYYSLHSVLSAVGYAGWDKLEALLTAHNDVLQLDLSGFSSLSSYKKDSAMKTLAAADSFADTDALQKALDKAVASVSSGGTGDSKGGSSSGGGGSRNASGALINVGDTAQNNTNETKVFYDIDHVLWAADSILTLYRRGIVSGRGEGAFCPDDMVTRAEFIKMLIAACASNGEQGAISFADVQPENWYYSYVARAAALSITQGYPDGSFGANDEITREDMAVMLSRLPQMKSLGGADNQSAFGDADQIAEYAKEAVQKLSSLGIFSGDDAGCFRPQSAATRAETAKVIAGILKIVS